MSSAPPSRHPAVRHWFLLATGFAFAAVILASLGIVSILYVHKTSEGSEAIAEGNVPRLVALADMRAAALRAAAAAFATAAGVAPDERGSEAGAIAQAWTDYDEARAAYDRTPGAHPEPLAAVDAAAAQLRPATASVAATGPAGTPAPGALERLSAAQATFVGGVADAMEAEHERTVTAQGRLMERARSGIEAMLEVTVMLGIVGGVLAFALVREAAVQINRSLQHLEEGGRLKTRFINKAAHELKTPLTPMGLQLDLLRRNPAVGGDERAGRAVDVLRRNFARLSGHVDTMLDVAVLEAGTETIETKPTGLAPLVSAAAASQGVASRVDVRVPPLVADVEPTRLSKALGILLLQAVRESPPSQPVVVTGERERGEIILRIRRAGAGLTEQQTARLFDAFGEEDSGSSDEAIGLRLRLGKILITSFGGVVGATSAGYSADGGLTFLVRLVAASTPKAGAARARANAAGMRAQPALPAPAGKDSDVASARNAP